MNQAARGKYAPGQLFFAKYVQVATVEARSCDRFDNAREEVVENKRNHDIQNLILLILEILAIDCLTEDELLQSLRGWYEYTDEEIVACINSLVSRGLVVRDGDDNMLMLSEHSAAEVMSPAA